MAEAHKAPLAIEATPANPDKDVSVMQVDGQSIKIDRLGPVLINSNGTISRITNWEELSDIERERTIRLLVKKRNLERMKKLEDSAPEGEEKVSALQDQDAAK